jgi:hypothetical protein
MPHANFGDILTLKKLFKVQIELAILYLFWQPIASNNHLTSSLLISKEESYLLSDYRGRFESKFVVFYSSNLCLWPSIIIVVFSIIVNEDLVFLPKMF